VSAADLDAAIAGDVGADLPRRSRTIRNGCVGVDVAIAAPAVTSASVTFMR
jgi:hypothetical protein